MAPEILYALGGAFLVAIGLCVMVAIPHLLRKILAFNVMASGIFLILVGLREAEAFTDPVPQALVLTGIVVAFASTALAVLLLRRWFHLSGRATLEPEHAYGYKYRHELDEKKPEPNRDVDSGGDA